MRNTWHMSSLQNLMKFVLKVAKMRSGRKLLGKKMYLKGLVHLKMNIS